MTLEELQQLCQDRRPEVVGSALEWIRSRPEAGYLPLLKAPLSSGSAALRRRVISLVEKIGTPAAATLALGVVDDDDEAVRLAAIGLLSKYPAGTHITPLLKALADPSGRIRESASQGLKPLLAAGNVIEHLIPLLSDANPKVRATSAELLRDQNPDLTVDAFIKTFQNVFGAARDRGVSAFREIGPRFLTALAARTTDADPNAASLAASIAVTLRSPEIVPLLIHLLTQPDWWLRHRAAEALAEIRDERGLEPLIALLADQDSNLSAAAALGAWANPRALAGLVEAYKRGSIDLRLEILDAFLKIRDPRVPALLQNIRQADPEPLVREKAVRAFAQLQGGGQIAQDVQGQKFERVDLAAKATLTLEDFLRDSRAREASDLHLSANTVPHIRIHGRLTPLPLPPLSTEALEKLLTPILNETQRGILTEQRSVDLCFKPSGLGRYRTNIFFQRKGINAVFRLIPTDIPSLDAIGLPQSVWVLADYAQGLILVTGSAGSGKTTTMAALVDRINRTQTCHVITVEDPIEYLHQSKESLITQREVPTHSESFAKALRQAFREDPDVIMVGEMRDLETISLAVTAAETGHLVLGTLHTATAGATIDRIIDAFPPGQQNQIRQMLADSLKGVIAQTLLPRQDGKGRIAAFEILRVTPNVAGLIREAKTFQLPSAMQTGAGAGMQTMDAAMLRLVEDGLADPSAAYDRALRKDLFEPYLEREASRA